MEEPETAPASPLPVLIGGGVLGLILVVLGFVRKVTWQRALLWVLGGLLLLIALWGLLLPRRAKEAAAPVPTASPIQTEAPEPTPAPASEPTLTPEPTPKPTPEAVLLFGQELALDTRELDLRQEEASVEELCELLSPFPGLQRVYLPLSLGVDPDVSPLAKAHPGTMFVYEVSFFGQTLFTDAPEADISKVKLADPQQVAAAMEKLPLLTKLVMCDCGLDNRQMEELMAQFPEVEFVWNIKIGTHTLRTDAIGFSTKNPTKYTKPYYSDAYNQKVKNTKRLKEGDIADLKYCTKLQALDLGHNYLTNADLEVLQYLPHLQILILADNKLTDISALSGLKELKYVELFMNRIPDMSPLVGLKELVDINIANTHLQSIEPLKQFTQAERLWFSMNDLTMEQNREVAEALPNCECNYHATNETDEGWREHPRYEWVLSYFPKGGVSY